MSRIEIRLNEMRNPDERYFIDINLSRRKFSVNGFTAYRPNIWRCLEYIDSCLSNFEGEINSMEIICGRGLSIDEMHHLIYLIDSHGAHNSVLDDLDD